MIKSRRSHPVIASILSVFEQLFGYLVSLAGYLTEKLFDLLVMAFVVLGVMFVAPVALDQEARTAFIARFLAQTCQVTKDCDLSHLLTGLAVALVILIGLVVFTFREASDENPILSIDNGDQKFINLLHSLELSDEEYERLADFIAAEFVQAKKPEAADEHTR